MKKLIIYLCLITIFIVIFYYISSQTSYKPLYGVNDCTNLREMIFTGKVINIKKSPYGKGTYHQVTLKGRHNLRKSFFSVKLENEMITVRLSPVFTEKNIDIGTTVRKLKGNYYFFFKKKDELKTDSIFIYANRYTPNPIYCDTLLK